LQHFVSQKLKNLGL